MKLSVFAVLAVCVIGCSSMKYCSFEDAEDVLTNWNSMMDDGNTAPYMLAIFKKVFEKLVILIQFNISRNNNNNNNNILCSNIKDIKDISKYK